VGEKVIEEERVNELDADGFEFFNEGAAEDEEDHPESAGGEAESGGEAEGHEQTNQEFDRWSGPGEGANSPLREGR